MEFFQMMNSMTNSQTWTYSKVINYIFRLKGSFAYFSEDIITNFEFKIVLRQTGVNLLRQYDVMQTVTMT